MDNQFVFAPLLQKFYRCHVGTGMGLVHSGFVSNLAYYVRVEKPFVHNLQPHGMLGYMRFFDDILTVFKDRQSMRDFLIPHVRNTAYFKLLADQVSGSSVQYLDLTISIVSSAFVTQPTLEKTPTPLCPTSCHTPGIHSAWPPAVANRVSMLADDPPAAHEKLKRSYVRANAHPSTVALLSARTAPQRLNSIGPQQPIVTMVLRYHPSFAAAVRRALALAPPPPHLGMKIVPSWRNALPSVSTKVSIANSTNAGRYHNDQGFNIEPRRVGTSLLSSSYTIRPAASMAEFTFAKL